MPRLLTSTYDAALAATQKRVLFSSKTRGVPHVRDHVQPGWPSYSRTNGESVFFSMDSSPFVPSWEAVQSKKAQLPMCLSEGGIASSTRAAQFIKASTRVVRRVVGRRTSLRHVQCTKVNSGISSTLVLQRSTLLSSRQPSHACAPRVTCPHFPVQFSPSSLSWRSASSEMRSAT